MGLCSNRKAFSTAFVAETLAGIIAALESKGERLKAEGRWTVIDQIRLEGLREAFAETVDFDLRFLANISHNLGLKFDFVLVDRAGRKFTDTGAIDQPRPSASEAER